MDDLCIRIDTSYYLRVSHLKQDGPPCSCNVYSSFPYYHEFRVAIKERSITFRKDFGVRKKLERSSFVCLARLPFSSPAPFLTSNFDETQMSSKRKWDQAAPVERDGSPGAKAAKADDGKSASEAAAAAAAIAAKIAAQFANSGGRDPHDGDYTYDIDINDQRNRYVLTKSTTQEQVGLNLSFLVVCWWFTK